MQRFLAESSDVLASSLYYWATFSNARRHSGAGRVTVSLRTEGEDLVAEVSDDGRGLGPEAVPGVGQGSMRERAAAAGGELRIESEPGRGTTVLLRVPLPREVRK